MIARRISLFTGLYLFAFVFAHLVNLSLGLHSVDTMDQARGWLIAPWTNLVGAGLLLACLFFHMLLGLRALYKRNTLRLNPFDAFQLLLGLSIPVLLFPHMITMALGSVLTDQHATYQQVLAHFWIDNPWLGLRQIIGLMVVWLHSCMGLFVWMRLQSWWGRVSLFVYPTVVLLPTLAMLGFVEAGKEVIASAESAPSAYQSTGYSSYQSSQSPQDSDGAYASDSDDGAGYGRQSPTEKTYADKGSYSRQGGQYGAAGYGGATETGSDYGSSDYGGSDYGNSDYGSSNNSTSDYGAGYGDSYGGAGEDSTYGVGGDQSMQVAAQAVRLSIYGYLLLLALVLAARAWRLYPAAQPVRIRIGDADAVTAPGGASLLEISRLHDIAHASLCSGKGRCGTCQVAILAGHENLSAQTEVETHKLKQIGAADNIRLACQALARSGDIHIEPVLPAYVIADDMPHRRPVPRQESATAIATNTDLIDDALPETGDRS